MIATLAEQDARQIVHYLPIATTVLSLVFVIMLLTRARKRSWAPHLVWWAIGIFFYGFGTAFESTITLTGNTVFLNRMWYWAGAILGGYPLATGSLYLIGKRKLAHVLTAISLAFVIFASVMVFIVPMDAAAIAAESHRPSGKFIVDEYKWVRLLTPFINLYAVVWLIGGAIWSSITFIVSRYNPRRAIGTALIAIGAILPGIGGSMAKADIVEALYIGEFLGLVLICIGYQICIKAPPPKPAYVCKSCGNDLRGTIGGAGDVCPDCGTPLDDATRRAADSTPAPAGSVASR